jgi:predicted ATPase
MMRTKLRIDNMKCFKELSLPLAPLTLLTGFNAAGKSTSVQSLLLLAQTARSQAKHWKIPLNGELVQLGSPGEALHEGAESGLLIGVETANACLSWRLKAEDGGQAHAMSIESIEWKIEEKSGEFLRCDLSLDGLLPPQPDPQLDALAGIIADTVYISAIRSGAEDSYPIPTAPEPILADVGVCGEFSAWWLEQMADEEVDPERRHPAEPALTLRRQFNAWAGTLFPGAQVNATRIPNTQLIQLSWRNHETDSWRRPSNIGYGLTYALPILVAALIARKGQVLVIDSPEAHLHPMGQSNMGRFLAMIAAAGVQVIIETHSDHVLNGVRRAVFDGKLVPADAAIHFFNARPRAPDDQAHVMSPQMDAKGNLSEWPAGFFDQAETDLSILAGWGI